MNNVRYEVGGPHNQGLLNLLRPPLRACTRPPSLAPSAVVLAASAQRIFPIRIFTSGGDC
eukprot:SAG11_NODE_605_length_8236_cov_3.988571_2_plen_60_part_00